MRTASTAVEKLRSQIDALERVFHSRSRRGLSPGRSPALTSATSDEEWSISSTAMPAPSVLAWHDVNGSHANIW
jgi:hypothetical protein